MLFGNPKNCWKKIPFVWKSFLIYAPLFGSLFAFFSFLTLVEIRHTNIDRAENLILNELENLKNTEFSEEVIRRVPQPLQIKLYSRTGNDFQTILEVNSFVEISPTLVPNKIQNLKNLETMVLNTPYQKDKEDFVLQIAKDFSMENKKLKQLRNFSILINFLGFLIAAVLSIPLTKSSLRGIIRMAEAAEQISYQNLTQRLEISGSNDEFDYLANTLNKMIDRIQISAESQINFISNASHELRTPIAVIKGYAQLLTRWGTDNKKIFVESAEAINKEIEMIQSLIENLLMISKVDVKLTEIKIEDLDFIQIINDVMRENKLLYPQRMFYFNTKIKKAPIKGDRYLIKALVRIFTENAHKYSPREDSINYVLFLKGKKLILNIVDHGIGIPNEQKNKVFERFYRVEETKTKENRGHGLGLAIAKQILTIHKWDVQIEDTLGGGTTISVRLPQIEGEPLLEEEGNDSE